jgi:hypothetical protein
VLAEILLNGTVTQGSAANNAPASVTISAVKSQRVFVGGIEAHYSAGVSAIKNVVFTYTVQGLGAQTMTYAWDFTRGPFLHNFPLLVHGDYNTAVSVTLDASGAGGVTGVCAIWSALV